MPFTLAHPVAAIPLRSLMGNAGVLSALIVGSVTPDLPYFLPLGVDRIDSHSPAGLLWFCLPAGLALYLLFHAALRPALTFLVPAALRNRLPVLPDKTWLPRAPLAAVFASLLAGATTHIAWDSFTHADGLLVRTLPILGVSLLEVDGYRVYVYKLLQHGSSLAGMAILAWWGWRWLVHARPRSPTAAWQPPEYAWAACWVILVGGSTTAGLVAGLETVGPTTGILALQRFLVVGVTCGMAALGGMLLILGLLWRAIDSRYAPRR